MRQSDGYIWSESSVLAMMCHGLYRVQKYVELNEYRLCN